MELGQKIKSLRKERGWSQDDLEYMSGIDRSTIAYLELGKIKNTSVENFFKLSQALGVHVNELFMAAGYLKDYATHDDGKSTREIIKQMKLLMRMLERNNKEGKTAEQP